jgi:tetratricopeptide (TPR) repeat protein
MKILFLSLLVMLFVRCTNNKKQIVQEKEIALDSLIKIYPDSVNLLVKLGNKYLDEYLYHEAIKLGAKAFRLDSTNLEARFLYANSLNNISTRSIEDIQQAQKHFITVIKKDGGNKKAYIALASTYSQLGDFEKSFKYINEVLRKDVKYRDAYILKGTNYLTLGKRDFAISSYETAIQQDPGFFEAYLKLGWIYSEDLKHDIAFERFKTASELKPTNIDALYGMGYSKQESGKHNEALAIYRNMLQIDPSFHIALFNQGYIKQFYQNEIDSAMYFYKSAIEMQPEFVKGWHNLGLCHVAKKDKTNALKCFSKALKYNPDFEISRIEANKLR